MSSATEIIFEALLGHFFGQGGAQRQGTQEGGYQHQQQQTPAGPMSGVVNYLSDFRTQAFAAALKGLQYLLLLEALLMSAAVLYFTLYWLVMPLRLHDKPLYFDHSNRDITGGAMATVDFLAQHTQWEPSPLLTIERLKGKVLNAGQHYYIELELEMPTSEINRNLGVFMVHTTLLDDEDNQLATSARPAMLPHTSGLLHAVRTLFSWPLDVFWSRGDTEIVLVPCMDFFEESALHPLTKAKMTVSSGWVQFYRASVHIKPQLKGLPWLMFNWFYSTLAVGVLFIASLELMVFGFCYVFFFLSLADRQSSDNSYFSNGNLNSSSSSNNNSSSQNNRHNNSTTTTTNNSSTSSSSQNNRHNNNNNSTTTTNNNSGNGNSGVSEIPVTDRKASADGGGGNGGGMGAALSEPSPPSRFYHDEGLRRRHNIGLTEAEPVDSSISSLGQNVPSFSSQIGLQQEEHPSPVQPHQRCARHYVGGSSGENAGPAGDRSILVPEPRANYYS